jgi:hypothetical protein
MDEHDPLVERLRSLGRDPVRPGVAARHLDAMAGAPVKTHRFVKVKVGTAFFAGLMLGGTGLAYADALPAPVQVAAHGALSDLGVSVPNGHGPARYNGPECSGGPYANHGQYVRSHHADPNAGTSRCGKPVQAGSGGATGDTEAPETPDTDQGNGPGAAHSGHGNKAKHATTPSTTAPAPRVPSTTVTPAKPSTTSTSSTTVTPAAPAKPSTTSTSSTTVTPAAPAKPSTTPTSSTPAN